MSKFKAGDMALIIKSRNHENIGRCVTIDSFTKHGDIFWADDLSIVKCTGNGAVVIGEIVTSLVGNPNKKSIVKKHVFLLSCLMPLKGTGDLEKLTEKILEISP